MLQILIFIVMLGTAWYVVITRPQKQQQSEHEQLVGGLSVGDYVMTVGGIYGAIVGLDGDIAQIEIAPGHVMRITVDGISRRATPPANTQAPSPSAPPITGDDVMHQQQPAEHQVQAQHAPGQQPLVAAPVQQVQAPAQPAQPVQPIQMAQPMAAPQPNAAPVPVPAAMQQPTNVGITVPNAAPAATAVAAQPAFELPKFQPSFGAQPGTAPGAAPVAMHAQPGAAHASPVPTTVQQPQTVAVAQPVPQVVAGHVAPPAGSAPPAPAPTAEPEGSGHAPLKDPGKRAGRSQTPDGYGPTATRGDTTHQQSFSQADAERSDLANAWQQASNAVVAEPHSSLMSQPVAPDGQQPAANGGHMQIQGDVFPVPMVPETAQAAPQTSAFSTGTPLTGGQSN